MLAHTLKQIVEALSDEVEVNERPRNLIHRVRTLAIRDLQTGRSVLRLEQRMPPETGSGRMSKLIHIAKTWILSTRSGRAPRVVRAVNNAAAVDATRQLLTSGDTVTVLELTAHGDLWASCGEELIEFADHGNKQFHFNADRSGHGCNVLGGEVTAPNASVAWGRIESLVRGYPGEWIVTLRCGSRRLKPRTISTSVDQTEEPEP